MVKAKHHEPDWIDGGPVDTDTTNPDQACCHCLVALAAAAACCCRQADCCRSDGDAKGSGCCAASLGLTLDAMQAHIDCLRATCTRIEKEAGSSESSAPAGPKGAKK
jgi:hypothetical protein